MASRAEERIRQGEKTIVQAPLPAALASVAEVAPILRGACAISIDRQEGLAKRQVLCFRTSSAILDYVSGADVARYSQVGVVTPDHTIRTKNWPLLVPAPEPATLHQWADAVRAAVGAFIERYNAYFERNNKRADKPRKPLDPLPRVILVPGVGMFGLGA